MDALIIAIRFAIVFIGSFLFGYERQSSHKPVGFTTFIFVSLGACALALVASFIGIQDSLPIIAAVVTGIGFLGAGALIRGQDRVFGFTTASGIWLFAIFGLVIGLGYYLIGVVIYLLVWIIISFDKYLERQGIGSYQRRLHLTLAKTVNEDKIKECFFSFGIKYKKLNIEIDKKKNELTIAYIIEGSKENLNKMAANLSGKEWLYYLKID